MQEFDADKEVRAFATVAGDQPIAAYLTKDGHVIVGTRQNASGARVDDAKLQELVAKPMGALAWEQLESSTWVPDGRADAPAWYIPSATRIARTATASGKLPDLG